MLITGIPFNNPKVCIKRDCYAMATTDGNSAEITMYGDIVESKPWWVNEETKYIVQDEFLEDLKQVENCKEITIRMNSLGGDAVVSNLIHNRLRELSKKGTKLTCIVDGAAMSGGSLIMCACDTVKVNPSSLIMIHKAWGFFWGAYNADELKNNAAIFDAYDKAQVEIYTRKTGLSNDEILSLMSETTYMTGKEAVEKGFADEVIEDAEPLNISASADGTSIFVKGKQVRLAPGIFAPDFIPTVETAQNAVDTNTSNTANAENSQGGTNTMPNENTNPTPQAQETSAQQTPAQQAPAQQTPSVSSEGGDVNVAVQNERARMQGIDEVAHLFDDSLVHEAKYGKTACDARELCHRAALAAAKNGKSFLASAIYDSAESGTASVGAAPAPEEAVAVSAKSESEKLADAKASVSALLGKSEKA